MPVNRFVSYVTLPWIRLVSRTRPLEGEVRTIRHFDERFTRLWERVKGKFAFAVRRDAAYLNWKYIQPPHVRYSIGVLERDARRRRLRRLPPRAGAARPRDAARGFPGGSATIRARLLTLLRWIDREARAADSDKIRTFSMHEGFRKLLRKSGYYSVKSTMEFVAKVNARRRARRRSTRTPSRWHVTLGDSDQDR